MAKFPVDAPKAKVIKTLEALGFYLVREGNHIVLARDEDDGTRTPMTIPNHANIKGSTLRHVLTLAGISRDEFLAAYENA